MHILKRNKENLEELKLLNERYDQEPANKGKKQLTICKADIILINWFQLFFKTNRT